MKQRLLTLFPALTRASACLIWVSLTYVLGVVAGAVMVHEKVPFALRYRDKLVGQAQASDPAASALNRGLPVRAALLDFARNLTLGAVPSTVMGLGVALPFPLAAFRGWIGALCQSMAHKGAVFEAVRVFIFPAFFSCNWRRILLPGRPAGTSAWPS